MKTPELHQWSQLNEGDIFGVLHSTYAVTFDDSGKATGAKKSFAIYSSQKNSDFGYPLSIDYFDDSYVVFTEDGIFQGSLNGNDFTRLTWPPTHSLNDDAVVCYGLYTITAGTDIYTWNGGSLSGDWVNRNGSLTAGIPHPMCNFESQSLYKLAVGNGNQVKMFDSSYNVSGTVLTLPVEQRVQTIRYRNGYLYVGTRNLNGGEARVYIWNGTGAAAQYECPVGCDWVFALTDYGSTVMAVVSSGQIGLVSGSQFYTKDMPAFPVYYRPDLRWQDNTGLLLNGKVFNKGIRTIGDRVFFNIDGSISNGFLPEMRSGLWVYDPRVGLSHRSAVSPQLFVSDSSLSVTNSEITTAVAHHLKDGDAVMFSTVSGLIGVASDTEYYAKIISDDTIKLAKSRRSLKAEKYLTITGTAGLSDSLMYVPNDDNADAYNNTSGAIAPVVTADGVLPLWKSKVIFGGRVTNKDGTARYVLNSLISSWNVSVIEYQRFYSQNIKDTWQSFISYLDGLHLENEEIVFKYRLHEKRETPVMQGVWLNENTINSVAGALDTDPWDDIIEGDEIVVVDGYGRGFSAHVVHLNPSSGTFSIELDEDIGVANQLLKFYATNYQKYNTVGEKEDDQTLATVAIDSIGGWVQLKVEKRGFEIATAINELSHQPAE